MKVALPPNRRRFFFQQQPPFSWLCVQWMFLGVWRVGIYISDEGTVCVGFWNLEILQLFVGVHPESIARSEMRSKAQ